MALKREEVQRVALLARLNLTPEEEDQLSEQLGKILEYVTTLERIDTSGVEPMSYALDVVNALRDDRVTNQRDQDALLANAPAADENFFRVPKIIE